jgi:hypothetical protein
MVRKTVSLILFLALLSVAASPLPQSVSHRVLLPLVVHSDSTIFLARPGEQTKPDREYAATYIGGTRLDYPVGIAVDNKGDIYIAGDTYSSDFPVTPGAFDLTCGSDGDCDFGRFGGAQADIFVVKISGKTGQIIYATYLGGGRDDHLTDMAIDQKGSVYLTGSTYSSDFPTTPGSYNREGSSSFPFVAKLSPQGSHLEYSTYLHWNMRGNTSLVVDKQGSAYISGHAFAVNEDFPLSPGAYQPDFPFEWGAFIIKLNPTGTGLVYATVLPYGSTVDIQVDRQGNTYVTGYSASAEFPTTPGAFDTTNTALDETYGDVFVSKLSADGTTLLYSTFLGGSDYDFARSLDITQQGAVVVVGQTYSTDFPVTAGSYRQQPEEIFLARLNPQGSALDFATYLGGSGEDSPGTVQVNSQGEVFIVGSTNSLDFPVMEDAFDQTCGTDGQCNKDEREFTRGDGFLTRFDASGENITYSTFYGGSESESLRRLALAQNGTLYFAGVTYSSDLPVTPGMFDMTYNGGGDIFTGWLRIK